MLHLGCTCHPLLVETQITSCFGLLLGSNGGVPAKRVLLLGSVDADGETDFVVGRMPRLYGRDTEEVRLHQPDKF